MKAINHIKRFRLILSLLLLPLISVCQEVPCREWYYTTDRNGNQIKGHCKQAWKVNSDGQKHGKFIQYHENGNPQYVKTYSNGIATGSYVEYKENGTTILIQGNYLNGDRIGKWRKNYDDGFLVVDFDEDVSYSYHWNNLVMKYEQEVGGLTGDVLICFEFTNHSYNYMTIKVNGERVSVIEFPIVIGLNEKWELGNSDIDGISIPEPDGLHIAANDLNKIIGKMKKNGIPQNSYAILRFSKGVLNTNTSYKIFDSTGHLVSN